MLCYSAVNPASLANIKQKWLPEVRHHCPETPILLVATKSDLRDDQRVLAELRSKLPPGAEPCVTSEQGKRMAEAIGAGAFIECSARTQHNLTHVFDEAIRLALEPPPVKKTGKRKGKKCSLF
jgi:GTPase SAR1 family protein